MARPLVAAGALFTDGAGRILLVRPTYKQHWDIPGGYVEPGESPFAACVREVAEELGIEPAIGDLLVVDWAPVDGEGDKLLFVFNGGQLSTENTNAMVLQSEEIAETAYIEPARLAQFIPGRLQLRLLVALQALAANRTIYAEYGARWPCGAVTRLAVPLG